MGVDAKLKRFFPFVVGGSLALTALLQASGVGRVVGSTIAEVPTVSPSGGVRAPKLPGLGAASDKPNGSIILSRNPFDSEAGPLDGTAVSMPDGGLPKADTPIASGDPYDDPSCEFGRVVLISAAEDPAWSFAAIQTSGGGPMLRRLGDEVSGYAVHYVSWDRVWFKSGTSRCQLKLGDKAKAGAAPAAAGAPADPAAKGGRGGRTLPADMAAKIHKVSDTEFNIERSLVDEILENQAQLMRSARIVPEKDGDKSTGVRLFGIRKGSLLSELGLQNSDKLVSINDFDISDPQKALEAYGRLRQADRLKVNVVRNGAPMAIDFNIQ
jgi:general secretion pathway protein C